MGPRPLVVGNWKMNGTVAFAGALLADLLAGLREASEPGTPLLRQLEVAVCPPYPYLALARERLVGTAVAVGAQTVCAQGDGAYTGEVSAAMLADLGCAWVIVGHSERRSLFGEDDAQVAAKAASALGAGLGAIVCVGETLAERERGAAESVLARQLAVLSALLASADPARLVIAYEPVWAIGTGRSASPQQAGEMHAFIRARLTAHGASGAVRLLYGGSVKPDNAEALFSVAGIDGGLIGGASLKAADFLDICRAAARAARAPSGVH